VEISFSQFSTRVRSVTGEERREEAGHERVERGREDRVSVPEDGDVAMLARTAP
jgi:hypothetical protein